MDNTKLLIEFMTYFETYRTRQNDLKYRQLFHERLKELCIRLDADFDEIERLLRD